MIKLIAFYEDQWMPPGTDRAQWDFLARAYRAEFQMVRAWSEALVPEGAAVVIADEHGDFDSRDREAHPAAAVYVFGRSGQPLVTEVRQHHPQAATMRVAIDGYKGTLFGITAASILLRDREHGGRNW